MTERTAIVTGGLTGIGLASAKALVRAGHRLAIGSRQAEAPDQASRIRDSLGTSVMLGTLDVGCDDSVNRFVATVRETLGTPQILVNAAGIYRETFLGDGDAASQEETDGNWSDQINVNLNGPFRMIRAVFPGMVRTRWGRIVNIASTAASTGASGYAGYCASKSGLVGLGMAVSKEGAPHGITCVSISPTWVETPMMARAVDRMARAAGTNAARILSDLERSNPQRRLVQPEEVAELVRFCCSDAVPALTHTDIPVNAGANW
ncbi:MAG: SDR family oxidoreductase [Paracoccaceae bacterium]|nr:SDR family oxidoreductase [Paracoccaceae bacterium]